MSRLTKGSLKSLFLHTQTHAPGNTKHRIPSASSSSSMVRGQNSWASLCSYGLHPLHGSPPRSSMQYLASSVTSRGLHFFWKFFRTCQATLSSRCQVRPAWPPPFCGLSLLPRFVSCAARAFVASPFLAQVEASPWPANRSALAAITRKRRRLRVCVWSSFPLRTFPLLCCFPVSLVLLSCLHAQC